MFPFAIVPTAILFTANAITVKISLAAAPLANTTLVPFEADISDSSSKTPFKYTFLLNDLPLILVK